MPRTKTQNQGAGDTRAQIVRKIQYMLRTKTNSGAYLALEELLGWIKSMDERAAKKKGGLGKR